MASVNKEACSNHGRWNSWKALYRLCFIGIVSTCLLQLPIIWYLAPVASDFALTQKIEGVYTYKSALKGRSSTFLGKRQLHCSISFMGPGFSCNHNELDGQLVVVELARYKHLFGTGERVVSVATGEQVEIAYRPEEIVKAWWRMSFFDALWNATLLTGIVGAIFLAFAERDEGK